MTIVLISLSSHISPMFAYHRAEEQKEYVFGSTINLITTQAKRNLSSRSGIGGVRSAT